jgi:hypothetical protein
MADQYIVNVSSINDFMQCHFRWLCKWVENRVPVVDARALRFGKLLHRVFELHLAVPGMPIKEALECARSQWEADAKDCTPDTPDWTVARDALDDLDQMWEPMLLWQDSYPFQVGCLEVEEPFEMNHPSDDSIRLRGRPDRVGIYQNRVYHVQNRSLAAGVNFPLYLELQKRNYHEHLYAVALQLKYGTDKPYGGTFFNLYRKLKYRKKQTKAQEAKGELGDILHPVSEIFWQHLMGIDLGSPLHKHVMTSLLTHARSMREVERRFREFGEVPAPNERLNGGPYGNTLDLYYRVLTGEITLDDPTYFKNREDTYAAVEES